MKRKNNSIKVAFLLISVFLVIIALLIKTNVISTKNNASPEVLYKNDKAIDFLVYQNTAYVNAFTIDWIQELKLIPEKQLGAIQRTNIKKNYQDFDATKLMEGTTIYTVKDRTDILLVLINDQYMPYYKYIEG
ncbi:hypothetical protein [Lachnoclostridium phytofermentans]|uniref:Uncharacterized protein n=1 Tax=Lachnoclostridium phytofermentans (strain ATCC 700394 / DSM 18823 / ISDg) TaxID=357809 RepID=A9KK11_LACP7|nr:hypothetical protein [Lachnoclostridium phytofermentans]ABX42583.1 conserved hypothetical protein [Lachnoclostridium phytofermentans ISDg]